MTNEWLWWSVDLAWKAALVMTLAALITVLMRRRAAAERHAVWLAAVVCVLMLPVLGAVFPSLTLRVPVREPVVRDVAPPAPASVQSFRASESPAPGTAPAVHVTAEEAAVAPAVRAPSTPLLPKRSTMLFALWLAGTVAVLSSILLAMLQVRRLAATAAPLRDGALLARTRAIAQSLGVTRTVTVLEGGAEMMPLTYGVIRPTLLLPSSAATWSAARQDAVLRHELAHVRRRDSLTQLLAGVACALHWFNPLAWVAARRMCVEREHACDDAVLAGGSRAADYAAELLAIARSMKVQRTTALAAIAMARPTQLRARLTALLEDRRRSDRVSTRLLVPVWLGAALLITPLSSLTPTLAERSEPLAPREADAPEKKKKGSKPKSHAPAPEARPEEAALQAGAGLGYGTKTVQEDCLSGRNSSVNSNSNDDRQTVKWSGTGCSGELMLEGTVEFDADFRRITSLSRNGELRVQTKENGTERRVVVRPSGSGVTYEYSVDGNRQELDAAGQQWLDRTLLFTFRRLGFMAEQRAASMLARGGVDAVLREVELLNSDYVRASYLGTAVEKGRLDEGTLRRVLNLAGSTIDSDYYVTSIVTKVAGEYEFTDAIRTVYLEAVSGIDSDYYQYTAFKALLEKGELSPAQIGAVLQDSRKIDSDYYRAELLSELNGRYAMSPAIRGTYLAAAGEIDSDYYKSEVLSKLMTNGSLGSQELVQLAEAASTIDSDHYRAEVLMTFARAASLDDETMQRAFVRAAGGIDSDYQLQQVLTKMAGRSDVNASTMNMILDAAETIDSDYYLSELLVDLVRSRRLDDASRNRVMKMMDGMSSETYRGRVATALLRQR